MEEARCETMQESKELKKESDLSVLENSIKNLKERCEEIYNRTEDLVLLIQHGTTTRNTEPEDMPTEKRESANRFNDMNNSVSDSVNKLFSTLNAIKQIKLILE